MKYKVIDGNGKDIGIDILKHYYGNVWKKALNHLNHQADGYVMTIKHYCNVYKVYRII